MMIKFLLRFVLFLAVLGMALEIFFRAIMPASIEPRTAYNENYEIRLYDTTATRTGLFTSGRYAQQRNRWHINNSGWNSPINYLPKKQRSKPCIALIGDSYIEGFYCNWEEHPAYLLQKHLKDAFDVYSFGYHGLVLSQYIVMARYIRDLFDPDLFIFFVNNRDLSGSLIYPGGVSPNLTFTYRDGQFETVHPFRPTTSRKNKLIASSALLRYLTLNALVDLFQMGQRDVAGDINKSQRRSQRRDNSNQAVVDQLLADHIIKMLKAEHPDQELFFVMDADRRSLYEHPDHPADPIEGSPEIQKACQTLGLQHLDLTQTFFADYQKNRRKFNFNHNNHWNPYGNQVVTEAISKFLRDEGMLIRFQQLDQFNTNFSDSASTNWINH